MDRRVCTVVVLGCLCGAHCALDSSASVDDPDDQSTEVLDAGNVFPKVDIDGASTEDIVREASADDSALLDVRSSGDHPDSATGISVTIGNVKPRTDVNGAIVDAHDGCLKQFGNSFYLYGTAYGTTDGFSTANRYRVYSSTDLMSWQPRGELLSGAPAGVYYRPYVIFNRTTRKYVLWYNWYATLWNGQLGVATSDKPEGPFTIVNDNVKVVNSGPGDENLFVDDDGSAYLIYTSIDKGHGMSIEKLSSDYLSSTMTTSGILAEGVEAPALFKRGTTYYALFDALCSFCSGGSGATVRTAPSPLGPYTSHGDINRSGGQIVVPAQQTFVAEITTASGIAYLWMGDMWGSRPDGVKGHDLQYWSAPLAFDGAGMIAPMTKVDGFTLRLP